MKLWKGFHDLMRKDGYPDRLIPYDSYWLFCWGPQSIRAVRSFKKLESLPESTPKKQMEDAQEHYAADKFACRFGKSGDKNFRNFIACASNEGISKAELRSLIMCKDLYAEKNGQIQLRESFIGLFIGKIFVLLCLVAFLLLSLLIISSPASVIVKIFLLLGYLIKYCVFAFIIYGCTIHPYLIARRLKPILERIKISFSNSQKTASLSIVK